MSAPHPISLPSGESGKVRGFGILNLVHWNLSGIRCLGFGAYYTLWMISSNSFLSERLDNDFRMAWYSSVVSN